MRKLLILFAILCFFLTACTNAKESELQEGFIWTSENELGSINQVTIRFAEIDLSERLYSVIGEDGEATEIFWNEESGSGGFATEPRTDLSQLLGQRIATREEAAVVAYRILMSEEFSFGSGLLDSLFIRHDSGEDIWWIMYGPSGEDGNPETGSAYHVALRGKTGELILMWID